MDLSDDYGGDRIDCETVFSLTVSAELGGGGGDAIPLYTVTSWLRNFGSSGFQGKTRVLLI